MGWGERLGGLGGLGGGNWRKRRAGLRRGFAVLPGLDPGWSFELPALADKQVPGVLWGRCGLDLVEGIEQELNRVLGLVVHEPGHEGLKQLRDLVLADILLPAVGCS